MKALRIGEKIAKVPIIQGGMGVGVSRSKLAEYVKGSSTKIAPIVSSAKAARVLLQRWEKKYDRTVDFVVIEDPKAGGHLGFSRDELEDIGGWSPGGVEVFGHKGMRCIAGIQRSIYPWFGR